MIDCIFFFWRAILRETHFGIQIWIKNNSCPKHAHVDMSVTLSTQSNRVHAMNFQKHRAQPKRSRSPGALGFESRNAYLEWLDECVTTILRSGPKRARDILEEIHEKYGIRPHIYNDIGWCLFEGATSRFARKIEKKPGGKWMLCATLSQHKV